MRLKTALRGMTILGGIMLATTAADAGWINGDFETGNSTGWTVGGGFRGGVLNPGLNPNDLLPSGSLYDAGIAGSHSSIINGAYVDPNVGGVIGTTVYSGNYSWRVEDTTNGGYGSVISQSVTNYTDPNIFFAWKAVLLGAHGTTDAATMIISLMDLTTNTELIHREYNAAAGGGGVDPRFSLSNNNFYTPQWQIEQLAIDASLTGHDFLLSVLGADCQPTGHWGYVYLDGFGNVAPPPGDAPEPATLALLAAGLLGIGAARRRRRAK